MGGSVLRWAFDLKSGQTIRLALLVMAGSFYVGALFGNEGPPIYVSQVESYSSVPPSSPSDFCSGSPSLSNKVELTNRRSPLSISVNGINVCPLEFNEYISCHYIKNVQALLPQLNVSQEEELERHCPPPEKRLFCSVPPPRDYKCPVRKPTRRDYVW